MSVQLSGAEEGDNITQGGEITFTCSVENVPGLTSVDWFRGEEHLETRDLVREEQRLVDSLKQTEEISAEKDRLSTRLEQLQVSWVETFTMSKECLTFRRRTKR